MVRVAITGNIPADGRTADVHSSRTSLRIESSTRGDAHRGLHRRTDRREEGSRPQADRAVHRQIGDALAVRDSSFTEKHLMFEMFYGTLAIISGAS